MKKRSAKSSTQIRKQHNYDLIRRMRNGDALYSFDSQASWYPPRPVIEKDKDEMARLYDKTEKAVAEAREAGNKGLFVLPRPNNDDHQEVG